MSYQPNKAISPREQLKGKNYRDSQGRLHLFHCHECDQDNWGEAIHQGRCAWCGWKDWPSATYPRKPRSIKIPSINYANLGGVIRL
jgi:hypothetical protein